MRKYAENGDNLTPEASSRGLKQRVEPRGAGRGTGGARPLSARQGLTKGGPREAGHQRPHRHPTGNPQRFPAEASPAAEQEMDSTGNLAFWHPK